MNRSTKAATIKAVCAVASDRQTLELARWQEMKPGGRASAHLDHYLLGKGRDLAVDLPQVLRDDRGVRIKRHNINQTQAFTA